MWVFFYLFEFVSSYLATVEVLARYSFLLVGLRHSRGELRPTYINTLSRNLVKGTSKESVRALLSDNFEIPAFPGF